jgi:FKBP-type peptidyl-prolyl cis-trans isomerase
LTVISAPAEDPGVLKDEKDKVSYAIGVNIGENFRARSLEVNPALVAKGMQEAYAGSKTLLTTNEVRETLMAFQQKQALKAQAQASAEGEKAKTEGLAYLAANKKKEGVKVLPVTVEGKPTPVELQYKVLKEGTGTSPKATDTVKVNYRGTLPDGKVFDSSYDRNEPATFPVNGVIKGWTEALQHMKPGGKWEIYLPSELAYGERGAGHDIPPNATLIFTVELLSIEKQ